MDQRELVHLKLAMEFGVAPVDGVLQKPVINEKGIPRLIVSRFGDEYAVFFRHDLSPERRRELSALGPEVMMRDESTTSAVLAQDAPVNKTYRVRWYTFEKMPDPSEYPDVTFVNGQYVVLVDGVVAAWAQTDCESADAAEVSIATEPEFRRRGFARQVSSAWSASVLSGGKVAFYSHVFANTASQGVATSLGLTHLSDEVEYM